MPPKTVFNLTFPWWLLIALFAFHIRIDAQEATAGDEILITQVKAPTDSTLELTFEETGDGFAEFKFETSIDLSASASAWSVIPSVALESISENNYRATLLLNEGENRFFRITGQGSSNDTDGDGVSNLQEEINGTNPLLADSDSDGFSDFVEIAQKTDPNDGSKKPDFSSLVAVRFTLRDEVIEEDNKTHIILLESNEPIFGSVNYTISSLSNVIENG